MILKILLLSLSVAFCFSQEKDTISIGEFEGKLNKLKISGLSAVSVKSEKLFPNQYDTIKDKYLTGRSAEGKLILLLPKFSPDYFIRDFVSKQQFSDAASLKKQIESTKTYLDSLSTNYEAKTFTCPFSLVEKVLSDNFDVKGKDATAVLTYSPNPNRTFSAANLLAKSAYNLMFVFFPNDVKLDDIFAEAASKEYDANAHQSFVDFVFAKASTDPTGNKVDLASLLQKFNKYSFADKKFVVDATTSSSKFDDYLFHVKDTKDAKNTNKVYIQIDNFWRPKESTDYNALLVKFLCMARQETIWAAKQREDNTHETDLNSGYVNMFMKLFIQYLCGENDFKEFFTTLAEYSISFDDFDKLINQELQTRAILNFSGFVAKSKAFKDTTKNFYVDKNNVCFTGSGITVDSLDNFLSAAKQSFHPKVSTNSKGVEEFLVHLQALPITTLAQVGGPSGKLPGKTPKKNKKIILWVLLPIIIMLMILLAGLWVRSHKISEKNSIKNYS